jgi:hypothetical protein
MIFRVAQAVYCMNVTYGRLLMNLFTVITWTTGLILQLNTILYKDEVPDFVNKLLRTEEYFSSKWNKYRL